MMVLKEHYVGLKSGKRTVVFAVGGVINLTKQLVIKNDDITIAGQTAPGEQEFV